MRPGTMYEDGTRFDTEQLKKWRDGPRWDGCPVVFAARFITEIIELREKLTATEALAERWDAEAIKLKEDNELGWGDEHKAAWGRQDALGDCADDLRELLSK